MADGQALQRLVIERLGRRGEGLARHDGALVAVPLALPGETVLADISGDRGTLRSIEQAAPDRREPECPLFGTCGGCAVQHLAEPSYRAWKTGLVASAMAQAGLEIPVLGFIDAHGEGRRRATFHLRTVESRWRAGFMAARSHDLVPVPHCPILVPGLQSAGATAEAATRSLARAAKPLDVQVTATEGGLELDIRGHGPVSERQRAMLTQVAAELDLARLSVHGDVIVERRPPLVRAGMVALVPPPGGFLQATEAGETALGDAVLQACAGARRVADLFSGSGAFALRLAGSAEVHAADGSASAMAALDRAARKAHGLRRIVAETRDLFRRPLLRGELDGFDAVVLDPPRAGAEAQVRQIAVSRVPKVAMVSCDAATFARDAGILQAAGFTTPGVTIVDQFRYSGHVELVAAFTRPARRDRR